jgi:CAAX prenyl protease-like protein
MRGGEKSMATTARAGHGWWPYLGPYLAFLAMVEIGARTPDSIDLLMLFLKPAVPLACIGIFWRQGAYPELRGRGLTASGAMQDVVVGILLAGLWMLPYLLFDGLRSGDPESGSWLPAFLQVDPESAFDPDFLGAGLAPLVLGLRMFGYALVTPIFEEIFIRSFVMRYSEVWPSGDFRNVPLAHYTVRSFISTVVVFTIGHVPWEWWVAVPWVALTNLWFYRRGNLWALVLVHAVTNATILLVAIYGGGLFFDAAGREISLWFFV